MARKKTIITPELRTEVIRARHGGMPWRDIAARFKIAKTTAERILRQHHGASSSDEADPELADLLAARQEISERIKQKRSRGGIRRRLLAFCLKYELSRVDVKAVIEKLPKTRITRKDREARLAQK